MPADIPGEVRRLPRVASPRRPGLDTLVYTMLMPVGAAETVLDAHQVFRILGEETLKDPGKLIPRRHMLEDILASHFDYTEMSMRALAAHWVPLTAGERAEFVELFKSFLSDRYAEKI
ncbi:MAG TPA: ABC transporter substrate-binding protein [Nitrospiraceae bacterium]|nr:ABC transporter substrate-binding protein [Nitrospiraceae bacterium]